MQDLVDEYFRVCGEVGFGDFHHPRLEALRNRMSHAQMRAIQERLMHEAAEAKREAAALEKYGKAKFGGVNDNGSS
jgi:hypothetical protein